MNTETRARGVHSSRPGGYTHNDAPAVCLSKLMRRARSTSKRAAAQRKNPLRNPAGHWIDFCKRRAQQEDG